MYDIAEKALQSYESAEGFALVLLRIVASPEFPQTTRLAAALYFKNFVGRRWIVRYLRAL
jgi:exportin-2 (importin alpha re-exporter)